MRLVTVKQAAAELFVTPSMFAYWKRKGHITTYPYELAASSVKVRKRTVSTRRYLVDMDELTSDLQLSTKDKRLLRPKEIAKILDVRIERVYGWVTRYSLTKYCPNLGSPKNYFLDGDEVADALVDAGFGYLIK